MMSVCKFKFRKGDSVVVIAGRSKGVVGEILSVNRDSQRVLVKGAQLVARHTKPSPQFPKGGKFQKEASLHVSNIAHLDPGNKKPTRVGIRWDDKKPVLFSKKSGQVIRPWGLK